MLIYDLYSKSDLYFNNNIFNVEYFNKLCDALKKNTKITEIYMSNIPDNTVNKILEMLNYNKTIRTFKINDNYNKSEDQKKIDKKLSENVNNII